MAKTSKPLTVWVSPDLEQEPSIQDLIRKGNTVKVLEDEPDIIFSRTSWRVVKGMEKLLPLAVSAARKVKYPKGDLSE